MAESAKKRQRALMLKGKKRKGKGVDQTLSKKNKVENEQVPSSDEQLLVCYCVCVWGGGG